MLEEFKVSNGLRQMLEEFKVSNGLRQMLHGSSAVQLVQSPDGREVASEAGRCGGSWS